ncbi:MAG: prepilin-type N-terminal cleavage/methylation domain-containing protein [Tenericutes bacterium]|nr:prepilin-type N-terminal cleavage/methylation domain-containing protein [Mycoplasmatota bacterium]
MKRKDGFTLVELLAVIAILAILIIIALPNILRMFNNAKKNSFVTEARSIFKTAEQNYITSNGEEWCYSNNYSGCGDLNMTGRTNVYYYVEFDNSGGIDYIEVMDDNYYIELYGEGPVSVEEISAENIQERNLD